MHRSGRPAPILPILAVVLLAACSRGDSRSGSEEPLFTLLPSSRTGVTFANSVQEDAVMNGFTYEYYYNGGGVAVGDLNADDLPDLYFTGNRVPNRLYLNRGDLRFEDVTEQAGVQGHPGWATGVTFADVDGDGRLDIYVSYSGAYDDPDLRRNQLYLNGGVREGIPVFTEKAGAYGLDDRGMSTQAAFFDYDVDGDLDAYVLNHGVVGSQRLMGFQGVLPFQADRLYRNDGERFVDVSAEAGMVDTNLGYGLGVSVGDVNRDRFPDFYVANDYAGRDYLYLGRGDGRFEEVLERAMPHIPYASMGSDLGDLDGDGWLDLVVLEMAMDNHYDHAMSSSGIDGGRFAALVEAGEHHQYVANALQWNRGPGEDGVPRFSDIAHLAGVARTDWSWAALFADLDNDGRSDLYVTTGTPSDMVHRDFQAYRTMRIDEVVEAEGRVTLSLMQDLLQNLPRREVPNRVYRNEGDLAFSDRTRDWGLERPSFSNGAAYADLDRDGDLDLVTNNLLAPASIHRNGTRERGGGHMLGVALRGPAGNAFGVGARVRIRAGGRQQVQELQLTRGYQSSVEPVLHFGLGDSDRVDTLEVVWPDGTREVRTDVEAGRYVTVEYPDPGDDSGGESGGDSGADAGGDPRPRPARAAAGAGSRLFSVADALLRPRPRHHAALSTGDSTLATYTSAREPLALAAGDVDGDGLEDFVFGGSVGAGGSGREPSRVWLQVPDGGFRGMRLPDPGGAEGAVTGAALLDADGDGRLDVWLVHEEAPRGSPRRYVHRLLLGTGDGGFREADPAAVPELARAGSVVAAGDMDGDGDEDVFVGGRAVPGSGEDARSHLLRNDGGRFTDVTAEAAPDLGGLSTVTAALWTDVDGDGARDLVVAGEWMPVQVWLGGPAGLSEAAGLDGLQGWWQSLAAADFDGDGDTDLVAGNVGLNYPYRPTERLPFELFVGDFDGDGEPEPVPGYYESGRLYPWLKRDHLAETLPSVMERYPTHHLYARATLDEILGPESLTSARRLQAGTFATLYLENGGGGRFTGRPLPAAAQVSPVMGAVPADFDGDGRMDLVVAGNMYELAPPVPRADAGVGLFLRGDGAGGFEAVPTPESGLRLDGPVRGLIGIASGAGRPPGLLAAVAGGEARYVRAGVPAGSLLAAGGEGAPAAPGQR